MDLAEATRAIRARSALAPDVALILGTGLGEATAACEVEETIPYDQIPGFPATTVEAHAGQLALGRLQGRAVAILQGRFHRYEGYSMAQLAFPVRVVRALGARVLVVTNIAGGMHPLWALGDIVVIADHINLMGESPLVGPNDDAIGPRFPDMSAAYDPRLRGLACTAARRRGLPVREGIYVAVTGPNLETAAEYRMLRTLGADVVGMSTVPEVITAVHAGMRVLALSVITDRCLPDALAPVDVPQILAIAQRSGPRLMEIVTDVVTELDG